ncbi:uncharacterized protein CANTADRAFT_23475 [Suhomyces tanzawaensis NRRL Y-17324]|uniref:Uncharacterized protein n=1 Tax=Suhomyces tanzawaensis NRRL Y-17324 TaxID=984487 RepID=A0A1E4SCV0_9ASCO|nr:uncharacterized protein CANTADRAFT_23475 [Suhomyces tanzawaensis NRRL Y-17324]ODV77347.1 hypothetical protein CANTADRAFT_23475 [Suhomyces tanzawaensis NRRL Y-17324]
MSYSSRGFKFARPLSSSFGKKKQLNTKYSTSSEGRTLPHANIVGVHNCLGAIRHKAPQKSFEEDTWKLSGKQPRKTSRDNGFFDTIRRGAKVETKFLKFFAPRPTVGIRPESATLRVIDSPTFGINLETQERQPSEISSFDIGACHQRCNAPYHSVLPRHESLRNRVLRSIKRRFVNLKRSKGKEVEMERQLQLRKIQQEYPFGAYKYQTRTSRPIETHEQEFKF